MTINKELNGKAAAVSVSGRLDSNTSTELEKVFQELLDLDSVTVDFAGLEYISSAGLRVLLSVHKMFASKGGLTILNAREAVLDIFEVTGLMDILNVK